MTDNETTNTPDNVPSAAAPETAVAPTTTRHEGSSSRQEWLIPVVGIGALLLAVALFAGGFFVARATEDSAPTAGGDDLVVHVGPRADVPRGDVPRGFGFMDFGQRGPQGRFGGPDGLPFENLDVIPAPILDRFCQLLDDGTIPENVPFVDRLTELCANKDANA
jgi:hypothetical protein